MPYLVIAHFSLAFNNIEWKYKKYENHIIANLCGYRGFTLLQIWAKNRKAILKYWKILGNKNCVGNLYLMQNNNFWLFFSYYQVIFCTGRWNNWEWNPINCLLTYTLIMFQVWLRLQAANLLLPVIWFSQEKKLSLPHLGNTLTITARGPSLDIRIWCL